MSDEVRQKIDSFRSEIDEIDCRLVELLNSRARLSLSIRELKPQANLALFDPKREEEIFLRLAACNEGPLFADNLREIFETVLRVMKEI
jgi:chorismate mutase